MIPPRKLLVGILVTCGLLTITFAVLISFSQPAAAPPELLRKARLELARGNFGKAEELALIAAKSPINSDPWGWMVAAEAAVRTKRTSEAIDYYSNVTTGAADLISAAAHGRAEMLLLQDSLTGAEAAYLAAIDADDNNLLSRRRLSDLFNLTGRRHRAVALMEGLIGSTQGTLEDLFYLGDVDHGVQVPEQWRQRAALSETDPLILLSVGYGALAENRLDEARTCFEKAASFLPDNADIAAGLGIALIQLNSSEIYTWNNRLTDEQRRDAGVLSVFGLWFERQQRHEDAVQAYGGAAALRTTSRIAWHRFGQSLSRTGRTKDAEIALQHAQQLQQMALWLDDLFDHRQQAELVRRVVMQLSLFNRVNEARAWSHYALEIAPENVWAAQWLAELTDRAMRAETASAESGNAESHMGNHALSLMLERVLIENWKPETGNLATSQSVMKIHETDTDVQFNFTDEAAVTGLDFTHLSGRDPSTEGARIPETTGGGVGVIDFDNDGWPDIYLPQGSAVFPAGPDNPDCDELFRNTRGQRWANISAVAGISDPDFSQGIAIGDFNNDGFQDVYLANYGFNRLLQNMGDGTFEDVTPSDMRQASVWTTSCLIADLNSDGNPDLFDVTYCRGANVETLICEQNGKPRSCSPRAFEAEVDRLWLSTGDGGWDRAAESSLDLPDGLGLGLVAFRPDFDQPLTLFIANDEAPNFWLRPEVSALSDTIVLEDAAAISGLAVDADGKPQACMGVAADDADGDGSTDLFITNFIQESNTLYAAVSPGFFEDRTRSAGLREPSWNLLGFGTQFLDVNLDGWPDLFIANGHIDDQSESGQQFEMPAQFFSNTRGDFTEVSNKTPLRSTLGRAVARIDWNRDGREDIVVANQHSPVQLLTNSTTGVGRSLVLQFRATSSARDAIGTIVQMKCGTRTITRQLTAGDGYMASNQRQIVLGLDPVQQIETLTVFWPGGSIQRLSEPELSAHTLLIEQRQPVSAE